MTGKRIFHPKKMVKYDRKGDRGESYWICQCARAWFGETQVLYKFSRCIWSGWTQTVNTFHSIALFMYIWKCARHKAASFIKMMANAKRIPCTLCVCCNETPNRNTFYNFDRSITTILPTLELDVLRTWILVHLYTFARFFVSLRIYLSIFSYYILNDHHT